MDMAGKNHYHYSLALSEDLLRRLLYIAQAENRTPNNHLLHLLRQNIAYFERTHGKISLTELQKISIELSDTENQD